MMRRTILLCLTLLGLVAWSGCARRSAPPSAAPPPTPETGRLWRALDAEILSREQLEELMRLEAEIGDQLGDRLAEVALDPLAPPLARAHSLRLLGERHWTGGLAPFRSALEARDPRVRAAAAVGLAGLIPMDQTAALRLLGRALQDPEPGVQAKALQSLADSDPELLRRYLAAVPAPELRAIAEELIRVAEERGAPLAQPGADGVLVRQTRPGERLVFRPRRHWPHWQAAVGELALEREGADPLILSAEVEAVARVVPAFFSPEGRYLVYESGREIRVRDLETGGERLLGKGIAPRVLPFTSQLVYLQERTAERIDQSGAITLKYDVVLTSFAAGGSAVLGRLTATARPVRHGNYSAARWMRVREQDGAFYLDGEGVQSFPLPDPFATASVEP